MIAFWWTMRRSRSSSLPINCQTPHFPLILSCSTSSDGHMRVSEDDLSKLDSSNPKGKRNLLVAWYGSLNDSGTIGDLLSVQTVTNHLVRIGHHVSHATS